MKLYEVGIDVPGWLGIGWNRHHYLVVADSERDARTLVRTKYGDDDCYAYTIVVEAEHEIPDEPKVVTRMHGL